MESEEVSINKFKLLGWTQWGSAIAVIVASFAWIHMDIRTVEARLDTHMIAINERTDQLYSIVIDLLKDQKGRQ